MNPIILSILNGSSHRWSGTKRLTISAGSRSKRGTASGYYLTNPLAKRFSSNFLLLLLICLLLGSCKVEHVPKVAVIEGDIVTRGTTNPATSKPLKMGLYEQRGQGEFIFRSSYYVLLHEFYTDDKGHFKLTYPLETLPSSYSVQIMEPVEGHFRSDYVKRLHSNAVNLFRMELHPHSWLKFVIDNRNGGQFDYFSFVIEGYDRLAFIGNSTAFDYFLVPGADSVQIVFNDHRYDPWKQRIYRVYVEGQDTTEHVVVIPPI